MDPYRYYFVLFEFESIYDSNNNDIIASIWEQKETFEKFKDCTSELSCITECEAFSSGFILATRIMAEVMQGLEEAENMLQTTVISKL